MNSSLFMSFFLQTKVYLMIYDSTLFYFFFIIVLIHFCQENSLRPARLYPSLTTVGLFCWLCALGHCSTAKALQCFLNFSPIHQSESENSAPPLWPMCVEVGAWEKFLHIYRKNNFALQIEGSWFCNINEGNTESEGRYNT